MECVYKRPEALSAFPGMFCPGCHHAILIKLIAEVIDEMGIRERSVLCSPIGCGGMTVLSANFDTVFSLHGRVPSTGAAIKMLNPESIVMCYQGDGDAAAIGTAETIHVARRGDPVTVFFVNNGVFGMTGGQVAPTSRLSDWTITSKKGNPYRPIHLPEMLATLEEPDYIARCAVNKPKNIIQTKKAIRHAFERQLEGKYSFIEVLSACVTTTGVKAENSPEFIDQVIASDFPLGEFKRDGKRV